jgi:hypothetical protein
MNSSVLSILGLHLWLGAWCLFAYQIFFRKMSERNYEWNEKMWGRFMILDKETYIIVEKLFMAGALPLAVIVYVLGLKELLK